MSRSPIGIVASARAVTAAPIAGITGKLLWLEPPSLGAAGALASWPDSSPLACTTTLIGAAPTIQTAQTPGGNKAVSFTGARGLTLSRTDVTTATANSYWDATYLPSNALDGSNATFWHAANTSMPAWWKASLGAIGRVATACTISVASGYITGPSTFKIQGSNDDTNWTDLDTRTGVAWTANVPQTFTFSNSTPYRWYRIYVTTCYGDGYLRIGTISFAGVETISPGGATARNGEFWIKLKSDLTNAGNNNGAYELGMDTQSSHYGYSSTIYDDAGCTVRQNFAMSLTVDSWRTYRVRISGTTWTAYLDGVLQATSTVSPAWRHMPLIGESRVTAGFQGKIAGALIVDHALDSTEAATVAAYFAAL